MKKFFYLIGALVTAAAVFAFVAILLKKLRISLSVEGLCDDEDGFDEDSRPDDITVTVNSDDPKDSDIEIEIENAEEAVAEDE